jgi:hypothetical protein
MVIKFAFFYLASSLIDRTVFLRGWSWGRSHEWEIQGIIHEQIRRKNREIQRRNGEIRIGTGIYGKIRGDVLQRISFAQKIFDDQPFEADHEGDFLSHEWEIQSRYREIPHGRFI